jgi:hypothetical protein
LVRALRHPSVAIGALAAQFAPVVQGNPESLTYLNVIRIGYCGIELTDFDDVRAVRPAKYMTAYSAGCGISLDHDCHKVIVHLRVL